MNVQEMLWIAVVVFLFVAFTESVKRLCRTYIQKHKQAGKRDRQNYFL